MDDWTKYRAEWRTPAIISPRGQLSNHHWTEDGLIGARVTEDTGTHLIVAVTTVERINS